MVLWIVQGFLSLTVNMDFGLWVSGFGLWALGFGLWTFMDLKLMPKFRIYSVLLAMKYSLSKDPYVMLCGDFCSHVSPWTSVKMCGLVTANPRFIPAASGQQMNGITVEHVPIRQGPQRRCRWFERTMTRRQCRRSAAALCCCSSRSRSTKRRQSLHNFWQDEQRVLPEGMHINVASPWPFNINYL